MLGIFLLAPVQDLTVASGAGLTIIARPQALAVMGELAAKVVTGDVEEMVALLALADQVAGALAELSSYSVP